MQDNNDMHDMPDFMRLESTADAFEWVANELEKLKDSNKVVLNTNQLHEIAREVRENANRS